MPLNIAANVAPVPGLDNPLELAMQGRNYRALGQQNQMRDMAMPYEPQRLQQEQLARTQQIQGFPIQQDAARLQNENMANDLAEMIISQGAKELKALPQEERAAAAQASILGRLERLRQRYPDYADVYDPSHFKDETWDDKSLTNWERISLSPEDRATLDAPPEAPKAGTFEDYVTKAYPGGYTADQLKSAFADWEGAKKVPSNTVNVVTGFEKRYDTDLGAGYAKKSLEIQDEGQKALGTITTLTAMESQLGNDKIYTGAAAVPVLALKRAAVALGGDPAEVEDTETFNALAKQAALASMGGSLGTGFSNADRDFVTEQVPGLQNTPAGNKKIIQVMRDINKRKVQLAKMAREYEKKNGRLDAGFYDEVEKFAEENPLFKKQGGKNDFTDFEQAKNLPVGTEFTVNGKKYVKGK